VYVAANPYVSALLPDRFCRIYSVWDYGWDNDLQTVPPVNVASEALKAHKEYPGQRMIVHFMQPHFPALTGKLARKGGFSRTRQVTQSKANPLEVFLKEGDLDVTVESLLEIGELEARDARFAYKQNLLIALDCVEELVAKLPGRTVVTSDHGELFGDRPGVLYPFKVFGHPTKLHVRPLVVVPWLIIDGEKVVASARYEETERHTLSEQDYEKVKDRLQKLGYL
jgi:hypothetical protein